MNLDSISERTKMNIEKLEIKDILIDNKFFLAGGFIRDLYLDIETKDMDFFSSYKDLDHNKLLNDLKSKNLEILSELDLQNKFCKLIKAKKEDILVDFVILNFGMDMLPIDVMEFTWNFSCNMGYISDFNDYKINFKECYLEDLRKKEIYFIKQNIFPIKRPRTFKKLESLIKKGFSINDESMKKYF